MLTTQKSKQVLTCWNCDTATHIFKGESTGSSLPYSRKYFKTPVKGTICKKTTKALISGVNLKSI